MTSVTSPTDQSDHGAAVFKAPLHQGAMGQDVARIHQILTGLGLAVAPGELREKRFGPSTFEAVSAWQRRHALAATGALDLEDLDRLWSEGKNIVRVVRGVVRLDDGAPAPDLVVVAVDRGFRAEQTLGETPTDRSGNYRITYTAASFTRSAKGSASLGLKIFSADRETLLFETPSRDLIDAPNDAVLDAVVTLPAGAVPSEFERIGAALQPILGEIPASDVAREAGAGEGHLLARETGLDQNRIAHFVVAHRVSELADIRPDYFYALLREDGLSGIAPGRPRAVLTPVSFHTDPKAVLFESVLLDKKLSQAAIRRAVRKRIVPPLVAEEAAAIGKQLESRRDEAQAYASQEVPRNILNLLGNLIESGKAGDLLALLGSYDLAELGQLFDRLDRRGVFAAADRDTAKTRLRLGELLGFNLGLVEEIASSLGADTPEALRALARLERKDWTRLIAKGTRRISIGGQELEPTLARRQASVVVRRFEKAFPTVAFTAQLRRRKKSFIAERSRIVEFLEANPDFELGQHRLAPFLESAGAARTSIAPEVMLGIEKLQRVFQLTGDYRKTEGLLEAGYTASADIAAAGQKRFLADAKEFAAMGQAEAERVFQQAQNVHLASVLVATNLRTLSWPKALEGASAETYNALIEKVVAEQPDLKSLFGSTDVCECGHCRSIYGPAAYFTDVMRFLRTRLVKNTTLPPGPSTKTAKEVLFSRRPDLGEIDLDCANAEVPVPHIDIVCELLEEALSPDPGFTFSGSIASGKPSAALLAKVRASGYDIGDFAVVYGPHAPNRFMLRDRNFTILAVGPGPGWKLRRLRQTHGSPEERAAAPEYVNAAAYQILKTGKAAFGLPYDLFHTETRAFLAAAGIDRADLMAALAAGGAPSADEIAGESLGLSAAERQLIFASAVASQPAIWAVPGPTAAATLSRLDHLSQRTGLEYREIERLIGFRWIRQAVDLFITHVLDQCNLEGKWILSLDDAVLDRMHRLLRLARKTGLAARDLDRLAAGPRLGNGDLGSRALRALAGLLRLSAELEVGVGRLITWLDVIPTDGEPSDHALLFENPTVTGPLDPRLGAAAIRQNEAAEAAAAGSGVRLAKVASDLALAFGVRPADLQLLLERVAEAALLGSDPPLTFRALGALYGRIGLARALGLSVADLVALERLAGIDPLADVAGLRQLVAAARAVAAVGIGIAELEYRLAHRAVNPAAFELAEGPIGKLLAAIRTGLLAAAGAHRSPFDPGLFAFEQIGAFETLLQRQPGLDAASIASLGDLIRLEMPGAAAGAAAIAVIEGPLARLVDTAAVKIAIGDLTAATPATVETRRKKVLELVMGGLSAAALRDAAFELANAALASLLRIPAGSSAAILRGARLPVGTASKPILDLLTLGQIADPAIPITRTGTSDLYRAVQLAVAVAGLMAPFDPAPETLAFLLDNAASFGWLGPDRIPFEAGLPAVPLAKWLELADFFALTAEFPAVPQVGRPDQNLSVADVFRLAFGPGAQKGPMLDALSILTGWPRTRVAEADSRLLFPLAAYLSPATWRALGRAVDLLHRLGVPLAEAVGYTAPALDDVHRRGARQLLRARYSDTDWLGALKNILDPIREQKRDALVAQLLAANPALTSKADLYDHFLTDTEWSAKLPSSRLVNAHGTVQLFVQRCIAGLEPKATADLDGDPDWRRWDWMKNYRVWEVARKVFVEAQYYIRPEWRDDKTEPFVDFEGAILQNEINEENVNAAFEGYLDRLDQIAFLDVLASCYDFDRDDLHVVAATKGGEPRAYFHRVLQRERVWTPWTKIELDIAGDNLVAFFRNKRLYLAWATFMEKGDDRQTARYPQPQGEGGPQELPETQRRTEIRLAVSEYTGKKWLPRRVSAGALFTPWDPRSQDQKKILLTVSPDPEHFVVNVFQIYTHYFYAWTTFPSTGVDQFYRIGYFLLAGCKGYPEAVPEDNPTRNYTIQPSFLDASLSGQRFVEQNLDQTDELAIFNSADGSALQWLFGRTPGTFRMSYPFQSSELDRMMTLAKNGGGPESERDAVTSLVYGTLMPFFFEDNQRGYVLVPGYYSEPDPKTGLRRTVKTFSNVRRFQLDVAALVAKYLRLLAEAHTQEEIDAVIAAILADPEYARILAESDSYNDTLFGYVVRNFYHPLICHLRQRFFEGGVPALLARATQLEIGPFRFEDPTTGHAPDPVILPPYPREELEFGRDSAYAAYNWELTFHAAHLIASKQMEAGRFDDAERWLRFIFDPLGSSNDPSPQRYWNTKPFYQRDPAEYGEQLVSAIFLRLGRDPAGAIETELVDTILEWRRSPFKPYLVARSRTVVFQQAIVDLTIRLFIGRGDQAFRRDQLEDLVLASLDYSRAERLLGLRPKVVPPAVEVPPETYDQLESKIDVFGNALRQLENLLPDLSVLPHHGAEVFPSPLTLESLYFCVPPSEKLYELWDLLEERQFNLRNSRTIDGVERTLSLFAPPLSVEALIQAAASGLSVSEVLSGLSAPRPPHRFRVMLRHAYECAESAGTFSRALEQALSSRDAEGLSRLKAAQEIQYLKEQTSQLGEEIKAAGLGIESARIAKVMHQETQRFYAERPYMNAWEIAANVSYGSSFALQALMVVGYVAAGGLSLVPKFMIGAAGFGGSPTANAQSGGDHISQAARDALVGALSAAAGAFDKAGSLLEHQGNYQVRKEDWAQAAKTAQHEVDRTELEIRIARIRETISKEQLRLNEVRRQQATAEETYLKSKFTNRELFDWSAQQLRSLSKQMFNLAFDAAKAAERCYNFELGAIDTFVRAGQWDGARYGLLAAENLSADLRLMESSHLKRNVRELELTKHLSLARLDPIALIELRTSGRCLIQVPEAVFDLEHPGHYFRRIKALTVSVPCVVGPYASVPLKLTQTSNRLRFKTEGAPYAETPGADPRFRYNVGSIQSIATSRGEEDAGLFELNLGDERYLPFEGSGACGSFVLELPQTLRSFDYGSISDVVLSLRYTARDGGSAFRTVVVGSLREQLNQMVLKTGRTGLWQAFDLRRDRPNVWHQLATTGTTSLTLSPADLPYFTSSRQVAITTARILARITGNPGAFQMTAGGAVTLNPPSEGDLAGLLSSSLSGVAFGSPVKIGTVLPNKIEELILLVNYTLNP